MQAMGATLSETVSRNEVLTAATAAQGLCTPARSGLPTPQQARRCPNRAASGALPVLRMPKLPGAENRCVLQARAKLPGPRGNIPERTHYVKKPFLQTLLEPA